MRIPIRALDTKPLGVRLWLVRLDEWRPTRPLVLSATEWSRAAKFAFENDRLRYLAAHDALREVLLRTVGVPRQLEFDVGSDGKPTLPPRFGAGFSLSHSQGWALIGLSEGQEIGVDIETIRTMPDSWALLQDYFRPEELAERTFAIAAESQPFLRGWTRKEACLKAVGVGLSLDPATFATGLVPDERRVLMLIGNCTVPVRVVSVKLDGPLVAAVASVSH